MAEDERVGRESYARELPKIQKKVLAFASESNRSDVVLALLSLEDAYDNLSNKVLEGTYLPDRRHPETTEVEQLAVTNHLGLKQALIEGGLGLVLESGRHVVRTLEMMPAITVAISGEDAETHLARLASGGRLTLAEVWQTVLAPVS